MVKYYTLRYANSRSWWLALPPGSAFDVSFPVNAYLVKQQVRRVYYFGLFHSQRRCG